MIPPIGQVVYRMFRGGWVIDYLRQARIGDEQFVLIWGDTGIRHQPSDWWRPVTLEESGLRATALDPAVEQSAPGFEPWAEQPADRLPLEP